MLSSNALLVMEEKKSWKTYKVGKYSEFPCSKSNNLLPSFDSILNSDFASFFKSGFLHFL